jgi:hypothetical protein
MVPGQLRQKTLQDSISMEKADYVIPVMVGSIIGVLKSRPAWAKSKTSISKITRAKRAGGMSQEVAALSSKCKALSSNSYILKKKKKYIHILYIHR